jgi:undecaprenyl diphosphate synthase
VNLRQKPFVPSEVEGRASTSLGTSGSAPRHVAIIMDGNGRWAKKRRLPRVAGHRRGVEAARQVVRAAGDLGIEVLTLYAFSSENWRRPAEEISDLMGLLRRFIIDDIDELAEAGVRLRVIGDYRAFQPDVVRLIDDAIARTAANSRTTLAVALNYGSQNELARAARLLAEQAAAGALDPSTITADSLDERLYTADLPPVDLLIRTSGERRLSNFLLWQAAYAELLFVDTLWPDFGRDELAAAVEDFARRERRFGGL